MIDYKNCYKIIATVEINPQYSDAYYNMGVAYAKKDQLDESIKSLQKALELNPNVRESNWFLGMAYAQADNVNEAVKYTNRAIELGYPYKENLSDILRLINVYKEVGDYDKIIELYKLAIDEQPNNVQFYASLAATYKEAGDIENAILYAKKAVEIDPKFSSESEAFINSLK